jgi:hypothetical protein
MVCLDQAGYPVQHFFAFGWRHAGPCARFIALSGSPHSAVYIRAIGERQSAQLLSIDGGNDRQIFAGNGLFPATIDEQALRLNRLVTKLIDELLIHFQFQSIRNQTARRSSVLINACLQDNLRQGGCHPISKVSSDHLWFTLIRACLDL